MRTGEERERCMEIIVYPLRSWGSRAVGQLEQTASRKLPWELVDSGLKMLYGLGE